MSTKKIRIGAFLLPSAGATVEQFKEGYIGKNPVAYQTSLRDNGRLIKQLDELGFDFVAFSEHHFHVEGFEMSNNPMMLGAWAASFTKNLRIGQMGIVLPARNPILVAEDLAMLDHFSEGRMFAGFARGYQSRHVSTIGQKFNARATYATDKEREENDRINRELFEENYNIIRMAWEKDMFSYDGEHWKIPPKGIAWNHPATKRFAKGMVDDETGELKQVGIAPTTLQDPNHIEVMIPFTMSERTIRWSAQEGAKPIIFTPIHEQIVQALDAYHQSAKEAGYHLEWGQGVGHFREIMIAESEEEANAMSNIGLGFIWHEWHDWFGFNEALRRPGETGPLPISPSFYRERNYSLSGTVDSVARKLDEMISKYNVELLVPWIFVGPTPMDAILRTNELLVEKVLPLVGVELERIQPHLRKEFIGPTWRQ